jgi:hypothetical protein
MIAPLEARCRRCDGAFTLAQVAEDPAGRCPFCGVALAPDWSFLLTREIPRLEEAERELAGSLRRLLGLPGHLAILPGSLIRSLLEEPGWERHLGDRPELLREEATRLEELAARWRAAAEPERRQAARPGLLGRLAARLGGHRATAAAA